MKIIKTRKDHICEKCGVTIRKGTTAITDELLDNTKSSTGKEYLGYFHLDCHKGTFPREYKAKREVSK